MSLRLTVVVLTFVYAPSVRLDRSTCAAAEPTFVSCSVNVVDVFGGVTALNCELLSTSVAGVCAVKSGALYARAASTARYALTRPAPCASAGA